MNQIVKIVLTGGPCAGKTTALQLIEEEFTEKGTMVFVVGESATEMINAGAKPFGSNAINCYDFQKSILGYQLYKEKMYENLAKTLPDDTKCIIVCDRGALDNKAYIEKAEFDKILEELQISEVDLLTRYQLVLHLVTAAKGALEFYTLANNEARSESPEVARELDDTTLSCWLGHPNLQVIGNEQDFKSKMKMVLRSIHKELGMPEPIQSQKKFIVSSASVGTFIESLKAYKKMRIEQTYDEREEEICYRKMSDESSSMYFEIRKKNTSDTSSRVKVMNRLSEKEYLRRTIAIDREPIIKDRYSFVYEGQYFRIDIFRNMDLCLLEVESTKENDRVTIPDGIVVEAEVTDNEEYRNSALFKKCQASQRRRIKN